jgi:uncharacterized protein YcbX
MIRRSRDGQRRGRRCDSRAWRAIIRKRAKLTRRRRSPIREHPEEAAIALAIGRIVKRITRCAAVNVDPELAVRDMEIPNMLMRRFGHNECGIYAEVVEGGEIAVGDTIAVEQPALL